MPATPLAGRTVAVQLLGTPKSVEHRGLRNAPSRYETGGQMLVAHGNVTRELMEPGLKELLTRVGDHELYHVDVFNDLLKEEVKRGSEK